MSPALCSRSDGSGRVYALRCSLRRGGEGDVSSALARLCAGVAVSVLCLVAPFDANFGHRTSMIHPIFRFVRDSFL